MSEHWQFEVVRLGHQHRGDRTPTYGRYRVLIDGVEQSELAGHVCEAPGPGDNSKAGKDKLRVKAGRYQLLRHFSKRYATADYASDPHEIGLHPMPALALGGEILDQRSDVLIHPGHPWEKPNREEAPISDLYLSSIGCLNLTGQLRADQEMNFWESRGRVIALIASLRAFVGSGFDDLGSKQPILGASVLIEGEPVGALD